MATNDTCCTIVPYFKVREGQLESFKALCERFVETTRTEPGCLYYGFSFDGDRALCREGYENAEAALFTCRKRRRPARGIPGICGDRPA